MHQLIHKIYSTALDPNAWSDLVVMLSIDSLIDEKEVDSHLNLANNLKIKHEKMEDQKDVITASLSLLPVALFTVLENSNKNTIEAINTKAQALLPELNQDLVKFCNRKIKLDASHNKQVYSEHVIYDEQSYFFLLLKLDQQSLSPTSNNPPVILVSLSNQYLFDDSELFDRWGFSPKETAICKLLLEGESIQSIADKNSRSIHTIRSQVKSIFNKSGCNSQISLIRRFYNSPLSINTLESNAVSATHSDMIHRKMRLSDGRQLSWSEQGNLNGKPVVICHSMHQSRKLRHTDTTFAIDQEIRVITPDRPGYGGSDPTASNKITSWPEDLNQLLQYIGLNKVSIIGLGLGTQFALMAAEQLGERVERTICVGLSHFIKPKIGCNFPSTVSQAACLLTKRSPKLVLKIFKLMGRDIFFKDPVSILTNFYKYPSDKDSAVLKNPEFQRLFINDFAECNRQGFGDATVHELTTLLNMERVIHPEKINTAVECWYVKNCENPNQEEIESLVKELPKGTSQCLNTENTFILYHEWQNYLYRAAFGKDRNFRQ